jgi:hypothetical protein
MEFLHSCARFKSNVTCMQVNSITVQSKPFDTYQIRQKEKLSILSKTETTIRPTKAKAVR